MSAHAYLAPSSAKIRQQCGAAARMMASYPKPDSEESREGTAAHWVAQDMLQNGGRNIAEGVVAPNGVGVTPEMIESAEVYYSDVIARVPDLQGLHIEEPVRIDSISEHSWGTPDNWHVTFETNPWRLTIWDYKYGHRYVSAFENWQMIEYAAGILDAIGITGINDTHIEVDFRVVQPRCFVGGGAARNWRIRASDLRGYFNTARMFEERSLKPDAPATSNPDCRDCCPGQCSAAQAAAYNGIDLSMQPQPFDMPPDALGIELAKIQRAIQALTAREDALGVQALEHIKHGVRVPGYTAQSSEGRLTWLETVPTEQVIALGELLDVKISKVVPVTPTQAIAAGVPKEVINTLAARPRGALKLVQDDGSAARLVFGAIDAGGQ